MPIKLFTAGGRIDAIKPIDNLDDWVFEQEQADEIDVEEFRRKLKEYQSRNQQHLYRKYIKHDGY